MESLTQLDTPSSITAYAETRIGGRSENQDSIGWQATPFGYLVTVCDGMGGGPGGKTASSIAVKEIIAGVTEAPKDEETTNILIKAIRRANMAIIEFAAEHPELSGMGSTCTVLLISENSAIVAHVGDSRVYQIRGKKKVFRTFDHSMVFELVKKKVITEEQARLSQQSNVITRALGAKPDVEVDCVELSFKKGDRFLLCTDGIHGSMPEEELVALVSDNKSKLAAVTDGIATKVDGDGRLNGGYHDNLTLAILETNVDSTKCQTWKWESKKYITYGIAIVVVAIITAVIMLSVGKSSGEGKSSDSSGQNDTTELNKKTDNTGQKNNNQNTQ